MRGRLPAFLKSLPRLDTINIENNHFTFSGMEPLVQHNFDGFYYDKQKKVAVHQSGNKLYVSAGGTLSNNTYKWYNSSTLVATINGDSTYTPTSSGTYHVQVTNSICTELILQSSNYTFNTLSSPQQNISLIQANNKNSFLLYPNPTHDFVNVYCSRRFQISNATLVIKNSGFKTL